MIPENVVFDVFMVEFQRNVDTWYSISPQNDARLQLPIKLVGKAENCVSLDPKMRSLNSRVLRGLRLA